MREINQKLDVALKDLLHNCDDRSGATDEYCKGIIVSCGTLLMAVTGANFPEALQEIVKRVPENTRDCFPPSWKQR